MKVYPSEKIRNVVLVGHQGTGKTSVAEYMVYNTGSLSRLGKVDEGNSVSDYLPEETKKRISISTSLLAFEHKDCKINLHFLFCRAILMPLETIYSGNQRRYRIGREPGG